MADIKHFNEATKVAVNSLQNLLDAGNFACVIHTDSVRQHVHGMRINLL